MMSHDLLEKILKNKISDEIDFNKLVDFLLLFKKGQYIYPSVLKRKFDFSDSEIYNILNCLEGAGYLRMYYEVYCGNCLQPIEIYKYYSQIQDSIYCENCCESTNITDNVKVIYKVEY